MAKHARPQPKPVTVYLFQWMNQATTLEKIDVTGIVPRRYIPVLKTNKGQKEINRRDRFIPVHDSRIPQLQDLVDTHNRAVDAWNIATKALETYVDALAFVTVTKNDSKEEALDKEPGFLEQLRTLPAAHEDTDQQS